MFNIFVNEYKNCVYPINELVSLKENSTFQILSTKIKFVYKFPENESENKFEFNSNNLFIAKYNVVINCNLKTLFDNTTNKILISNDGINGFYLPKYSSGYYEVELILLQDNRLINFLIKNNFNFTTNNKFPKIQILPIQITDFSQYKNIDFYD